MSTTKELTLAQELEILKPEVAKVLPDHVSADKFIRTVMTAIAQSPDLRSADRRSLFTSCVKAATDGLVPDGREAALVIFSGRNGKQVQYMPMVAGILKKVRNSGELKSISSNVVYEADEFRYWVDDLGEHVTHAPNIFAENRGPFLAVYAVAKTKDDGVYIEVMTKSQVEQVKSVSRSGNNGPWGSWYDEMARKTVMRRLAKRLPMSTDLETVVSRVDEDYDFSRSTGRNVENASGVEGARAALGFDGLGSAGAAENSEEGGLQDGAEISGVDTSTGEVLVGKWTEKEAIEILESKRTTKTLTAAYDEICDDFRETGRELSDAVGVKFQEMSEALAEREKV